MFWLDGLDKMLGEWETPVSTIWAIGTFQPNSPVTSSESNSHSPIGYKQDQLESVTEEIVQVLSSEDDEPGFLDGERSFCETLGTIACGKIAILAHNALCLVGLEHQLAVVVTGATAPPIHSDGPDWSSPCRAPCLMGFFAICIAFQANIVFSFLASMIVRRYGEDESRDKRDGHRS